jgi:ATP-dependent DNA ligase
MRVINVASHFTFSFNIAEGADQVLHCLKGQRAILDGEIVVLDGGGRSNFRDLMSSHTK